MFISERANVQTRLLARAAIVFDQTVIGDNIIVDPCVILGYPTRDSIRKIKNNVLYAPTLKLLDHASREYHIRSGIVIYKSTVISDNVETGHSVLIREHISIGNNAVLGAQTVIEGYVIKMGNNVRIKSGVFIPIYTVLDNNVFLGPYTVVTNDNYPNSKRMERVVIGDSVVIGG